MPRKVNHFKGLTPGGALAKLNSLPTTRVDVPYETPRQRIERELREEEAASIQRRTAVPRQQENALRAEAEGKIKAFWSKPLLELATFFDPNKKVSDWQGALLTAKGAKKEFAGLCDVNLGQFPTAPVVTLEKATAAFGEFRKNLPASSGYVLSDQGAMRLLAYVMVQADEQQADSGSPEMYLIAFQRLLSLGCFDEASGEIGYDENLQTEFSEPVAAPSLEEIDSSTEAGREQEKRLVREAFKDANTPIWQEWLASLANGFGFNITEQEQQQALRVFTERNFSMLDRRNFDRVRVILVKRGTFPDYCLTPDEKLSDEIETAGDISSYEGKRRLIARLAELRQQ